MKIEIVKRADGAGLLRCTRDDGSVTWQKQAKHGAHFALHDLTHFAVETCLGCRRGFFGLIADGWGIDDTTGTGGRGTLPTGATDVERIVGLFDTERASGALLTLQEFNEHGPLPVTAEQIDCVRKLRSSLFKQWRETEVGETLELRFG